MRKSLLMLAGAAGLAAAGLLPDRANAIGLPGAQSIGAAIDAADLTERVHCRPGWWHHKYRPHNGCYRVYRRHYHYGGPYVYRPGPYFYGGPYVYGPGPYVYGGPGVTVYGPGVSFGFGFGPRWGW